MISLTVFLIPNSDNEAEYVVTIDAHKFVIVGVLLQDDASRYLRSCIYLAGRLSVCAAHYTTYACEALAVVETVSRVQMIYLIG